MTIPIEIENQLEILSDEVWRCASMTINAPLARCLEITSKDCPPWSQAKGMAIKADAVLVVHSVFPNLEIPRQVPAEFWVTPLGKVLLDAMLWADQDELVTLSQAAKVSGRSLSQLSSYARGRIPSFLVLTKNPTHATRLRMSDVLALKPKRQPSLD